MAIPSPANGEEFTRQLTRVVNPDGSNIGQTTPNGDSLIDDTVDAMKVTLATKIAGESLTDDVMKTEEQYSNYTATADGQVKASSGRLRSLTFSATGTVTAGVITVYDSLTETSTVIWSGTIQVGLNPVTITLNVPFATGCYIGYDGTIANVRTQASYR